MKPFNLEEYLKNPSRNVVTRSGKPVIIHCTNYESDGPIIAEVKGYNKSRSYQRNGRYYLYDDSNLDLFFAPERHEGWVNIYKNQMTGSMYCDCNIYASNEDAKKQHGIAIARIEWEE